MFKEYTYSEISNNFGLFLSVDCISLKFQVTHLSFVAQTGRIKQNQINCLKIDIAIDIDEKDAKRITTVAVEAVCLLTDVGRHRWARWCKTGRPGKGFLAKTTDSLNELDEGWRGLLGAIRLPWYLKINFDLFENERLWIIHDLAVDVVGVQEGFFKAFNRADCGLRGC